MFDLLIFFPLVSTVHVQTKNAKLKEEKIIKEFTFMKDINSYKLQIKNFLQSNDGFFLCA
jgi:hypothetical protein